MPVIFVLLLILVAGVWAVQRYAPPEHVPWKPLSLDDPPGLATAMKLRRLHDAPETCQALLVQLDRAARSLPDRTDGPRCGWSQAVALDGLSGVDLRPGAPPLACPMVVATALWLRWSVQPQAEIIYGQRVAALRHMGSYACRTVRGSQTGRMSEHARANALDIGGFVLADGRRIDLPAAWFDDGEDGQFIRAVHSGGCDLFAVTLGPDYNAAHADHFHFDLGPFNTCR